MGDGGFPVGQVVALERLQRDVRRFGIEVEIELGRRRDVAVAGDRAAHHHEAGDPLRQRGIQLERQRDVGQRAQRDQHQPPRVCVGQAQDGQSRVFVLGLACGRREADVAEAILPVHIAGVRRRV